MFVFLLVVLAILGVGVVLGTITGLYVGMFAFLVSTLAQVLWLWYRSRPVLQGYRDRDGAASEAG